MKYDMMDEIHKRTSPLRIFLCHSSGDKPEVRNLYQRLSSDGFDPWLDEEDLLPGQQWKVEIPKAVKTSDVVIVCLSHKAINKAGYVQKEIKFALDKAEEQPEDTISLIPLKLEECDVPERLQRWQWVNLFEEKGYERLMSSLQMQAITAGVTQTKEIFTNSIGMKFKLIPAGEFMMGSGIHSSEKPIHKVTINEQFHLGTYSVTQREWKALMGTNPSYFRGDDLPVVNVSWDDVQKFIKKLNEKEGTGKYRLPSEAEWEYACRAGSITEYCFGDSKSKLGEYAWYADNSGGKTHPVGQKQPNQWGLYDMHGNVWEWVQDRWHFYGASDDGSVWDDGSSANRVVRGGGWRISARFCRSANRSNSLPFSHGYNFGFRLLQEL